MRIHTTLIAGGALLLGACAAPVPPQAPTARADLLLATESGMHNVVIDSGHAYLGLSNAAGAGTAVWRTARIIRRSSAWEPLELGECAAGPAREGEPALAPRLARVAGKVYLSQPGTQVKPPTLCRLMRDKARFVQTSLNEAALPPMASLLALRGTPGSLLAGGFDQERGRAYLAWSRDGGKNWTDLSASLPAGELTSLLQDPSGRLLLTLNAAPGSQGRLMMLTLAAPVP